MKKHLLSGLMGAALFCHAATPSQAFIQIVQVGSSGFNPNVFTPNIATVNAGDTIQFNFDFGTHNVTSTTIPVGATAFASPTQSSGTFLVIPTVGGIYNYHCTLHPNMTGSFTVNPGTTVPTTPVITPSGPVTICSGQSAMLMASATGATQWQWSESGNPISGATSDMYSATTAGSYTVVASNANGSAPTSAAVQVIVNQTPVLSAVQSSPNVCQGKCDTITVTGAASYSISINPQNMGIVSGNQVIICPTSVNSPSPYVFAIDGTTNGCTATIPQTLQVIAQPSASYTYTHAGLDYSFVNTSSNTTTGISYTWDFGDGQSSTAPTPPVHSYAAAGMYTVTLTADNGSGCTSIMSQQIQVLGIGNIPGAGAFSFGPNPASDVLNVHTGSLRASLSLYDYTGRFIRTLNDPGDTASDYSFNVSDIPSGLYMLQIKANGKMAMEKLIIQK